MSPIEHPLYRPLSPVVKRRGTLFVATYEMPRHLSLVCEALLRQSTNQFEVVFCDDGSGPATKEIIQNFSRRAPFKVIHVWQENKGFRKCRILNEGLRQSSEEVLIFLDGDTVPHRKYIQDHLEQQENGVYLAGRRVMLGEALSNALTPETVAQGYFDYPRLSLFKDVILGRSQYFQRSFRVGHNGLRRILRMDRVTDMIGCNYSVARWAMEAINGFDEEYEGYGREDTDAEIRFQNLGLRIKSLKGLALQFHVWHPRREFTPANEDRLEELRRSKRIRCEKGIKVVTT